MAAFKPIKTKCFIAFLKYKKCVEKRSKGSHHQYKCPGCWRTITIRPKDKNIPPLHVMTNLKSMGVSMADFKAWADKNC
ncbi:MAG TPA: type II toxin-antitoxin system HicA family toxin [Flavobacteriia bacterium]|nr:type II toxin-antitoxin system HicA family toxin [Flavobacteriia bacterium]